MRQLLVVGVDEAGRGPLAGPVTAAAVILDPLKPIQDLDDSKKLSANKRQQLEKEIKSHALYWSVCCASVEEIDKINILQATMLAMRRAVEQLGVSPDLALVDGNRKPGLLCETRAVIGGDHLHPEISAASILAKESRDRTMCALAEEYPDYGFDRHKGYPTKMHIAALSKYGVTMHHRRSFAPVRNALLDELVIR